MKQIIPTQVCCLLGVGAGARGRAQTQARGRKWEMPKEQC